MTSPKPSWPFNVSHDFANWLHRRQVVAVRKHIDPVSEVPSAVFMCAGAVAIHMGGGSSAVFLGEDHQRYVYDGFDFAKLLDEIEFDFFSTAEGCVKLRPQVAARLAEIISWETQHGNESVASQ